MTIEFSTLNFKTMNFNKGLTLIVAITMALISCEYENDFSNVDQSAIVTIEDRDNGNIIEKIEFLDIAVPDTAIRTFKVVFYQFENGENIDVTYSLPTGSKFTIDTMYNDANTSEKAYSVEHIAIEFISTAEMVQDTISEIFTITAAHRTKTLTINAFVQ